MRDSEIKTSQEASILPVSQASYQFLYNLWIHFQYINTEFPIEGKVSYISKLQ